MRKFRSRGEGFLAFFPFSKDPSDVFKSTTRELFGRLTQTLTGHGYTGEHYQHMQIPDMELWCKCSTSIGVPTFHSG